jgi:DNA-binding Lrp family transcriptional regulator
MSCKFQKAFYLLREQLVEESQMPTAFVLINTELGSETEVLKELRKVEGVNEAYAVYGTYDLIARVKADTMEKLKEIVTARIRRLTNVKATLTLMSSEETVQP